MEGMNPVYARALDVIWDSINGGIGHPNDFEKVIAMFTRLLSEGETVYPGQIYQYLKNKGISDRPANDIQMIYEVLETARHGRRLWNEEFIQGILGRSN